MLKTIKTIALAAAIGLFGTAAQAQDYPTMNLKLAHFVPDNWTGSKVDQWFADEVKKRSGGKITIQIFWGESMGKAMELLNLVRSGAVDMAATAQGYFPSQLPLVGATNALMMQFDNNGQAVRITTEMVEQNAAIQEELKRNNIHPIYFHSVNVFRPLCSKKIEKIEDFKGLKIRAWGEYVPAMWKSLGATGVNVLPQEMYESLQRGTIDCAFYPADLSDASKLYEVAKFTWNQNLGAIPTWALWVNAKTWNETWPKSVRDLFTQVGKEAMELDIRMTREAEQAALANMKKHGVQMHDFNDMAKLKATVPDLADMWVEKMKEKGLEAPAREMVTYWRKRRTEVTN
jgi:TRAP-type C4-dicarboxylate transport system substrate-binding protein